jgi:hypothetical protein
MGVGIVAGAPYYCAEDSFFNMLLKCAVVPFLVNVNDLAYKTRAFANSGSIDSVDGLRHDKVMLVSGKLDLHVRQGVMKKLYDYYKIFVDESNIAKQFDIVAPHAMVCLLFSSTLIYRDGGFGWAPASTLLSYVYTVLGR